MVVGLVSMPSPVRKVLSRGLESVRSLASVKSLFRSWLGVDSHSSGEPQPALRELLDALDRLEPARARYLAQFAYLLGRVAHADQHVGPEETRAMEHLIAQEGEFS